MSLVTVEIKDTSVAKSVAAGLISTTRGAPGFSVDPPGGLEVFGEDHGWLFTVTPEQAAVIQYWLGDTYKVSIRVGETS